MVGEKNMAKEVMSPFQLFCEKSCGVSRRA